METGTRSAHAATCATTGRAAPDGALERILEAARRAPSAGNRQPWDFVVVTGRERLAELATVWRGAGHVAGSQATVALVGPLVETQRERDWLQFDMGQAALQMAVVAADLGVGSCHSAIGDQALAQRILHYPDGRSCIALLSFGMPRDRPLVPLRRPARRPLDEVVHRDRWWPASAREDSGRSRVFRQSTVRGTPPRRRTPSPTGGGPRTPTRPPFRKPAAAGGSDEDRGRPGRARPHPAPRGPVAARSRAARERPAGSSPSPPATSRPRRETRGSASS